MKILANLFIVIIFILSLHSSSYADWADEWLGTMLSENPSSYEGQQRGYFSGGGFTARKKMHTDYLFSAQAPKINIGCGGIDIFLGAFSFLNPDYLVDKATRIIQAAPVYAFELALSNLCQSCDNIMAKIQNIMDKLNSLQMDECKASKALVTIGAEYVRDGESKTLGAVKSSIKQGYDNFFTDAKKEAQDNPVSKQKEALNGLNTTINKLKAPVNNSFLDTFKNDTGLNYVNEVRALVGDVYLIWNDNAGLQSGYIDGCANANIKNYVENGILEKAGAEPNSPCNEVSYKSYKKRVEENIVSILDKMKNSPIANLAPPEKDFINFVEIPVYSLLRDSVMESDFLADSVSDHIVTPAAYSYAYGVLNNIYNTAKTVISQIEANIIFGDKDNMLSDLIMQINKMLGKIDELKKSSQDEYFNQKKSFDEKMKTIVAYKQKREFVKKAITESLFEKKQVR